MMPCSAATKRGYLNHGTAWTHLSTRYLSQTSVAESQSHANTATRLITQPRNAPYPRCCHKAGEGQHTGPLPLLMTAHSQEANALLPTLGSVQFAHLGMPGTANFQESARMPMCAHTVTVATRLHHAGSQRTRARHRNKSRRTSTGVEFSCHLTMSP